MATLSELHTARIGAVFRFCYRATVSLRRFFLALFAPPLRGIAGHTSAYRVVCWRTCIDRVLPLSIQTTSTHPVACTLLAYCCSSVERAKWQNAICVCLSLSLAATSISYQLSAVYKAAASIGLACPFYRSTPYLLTILVFTTRRPLPSVRHRYARCFIGAHSVLPHLLTVRRGQATFAGSTTCITHRQ